MPAPEQRRHPVQPTGLLRGALLGACLGGAALASCFQPTLPLDEGQTLIDSSGGVVRTASGASLEFPEGAVLTPTAISFRPVETPRLPGRLRSAGQAYLARPEGARFAKPVLVTLPIPGAADEDVLVATAPQGSRTYELLPTTRGGATVRAPVSHFSLFVPVAGARDAGAPPPDPDAGGAGRPDVGYVRWDAGAPLACAAPDTGFCLFNAAYPLDLECRFKSTCSDGLTTRDVACSGSTCTCGTRSPTVPVTEWTVPWSGDCSLDGYRQAWTCGCGFPALRTSPPCPDAGVAPDPGLPLASTCARDSDCASGDCFGAFCTRACDDAAPCPCGFACAPGYGVCWPATW